MNKCDNPQNYQEYKETQSIRSQAKWNSVTFDEKNFFKVLLTALPKMIVKHTGKNLRPDSICCMGIRNGNEYSSLKRLQKSVSEIEKAKIYGVDINESVKSVGDNCFAYDFNHLPNDWQSKFDVVYSNSIDHSYNLDETLREWHRVISRDRFLLLQLATNSKVSTTDIYCFFPEDCQNIFSEKLFDVVHVWEEYEEKDFFNVLLRVKK